MKKHEKYLKVLKSFDGYITIEEWATRFAEVYPEETNQEKDKKIIIRDLIKNISALISTKKWDSCTSEEPNTKPKKIKYDINKQKEDKMNINPKDNKKIAFKVIMDDLKYMDDNNTRRKDYDYFEDAKIDGYKYYIAFQMAIRNKDVIEITEKLDYINEIITNKLIPNSLREWIYGIKNWEDTYNREPPEYIIDKSFKKKVYIDIAESIFEDFKKDIDSKINRKKYEEENYGYAIVLKVIADYLQNRLTKEYYIYKDGYYFIKDQGYFNPEEVIDDDAIDKYNYNTYELENSIKAFINTLIDRKTNHLKNTADMFFMYDYSKNEEENNVDDYNRYAQVPINQTIKLILTKHHGLEIEKLKVTYTYDECLKKYEELTKYEVSFYTVEKTIQNKIDLMERFIEQKLYKYILFY